MRCLYALPCLMILLAAPATAATVSLHSDGDAATVVMGMAEDLLGQDISLAQELLADHAHSPLHLVLHQARGDMVAQALAHALGMWYVPDDGGYRFTRAPVLPAVGPIDVRTIPTRVSDARAIHDIIGELLAPWMGEHCGFAFHPFQGRWAATLDSAGHARFRQLITVLEKPEAHIPIITRPAIPSATIGQDISARTWFELAEQLVDATACSVSIAPDRGQHIFDPPLSLAADRPLADLPLILAGHGVHGRWHGQLLLLDDLQQRFDSGRHPALRRLLAVIPVAQFTNHTDAAALLNDLRRHLPEQTWQRPGYGLYHLANAESILIAADRASIAAILERLEHHEGQLP